MATRLIDSFGPEVPGRIARMVAAVDPAFDGEAFLADALDGYEPLALMDRGRHWGAALRAHLPGDDPTAIRTLTASLGPARTDDGDSGGEGMAAFLHLPHSFVIAEHGLGCVDVSIDAMHALTRRFTAEFCIRPFIAQDQEGMLARLLAWTDDPSAHVRRLVSEGTRPRLPWAGRLRGLQRDPAPVLPLLERLRDDPSEYVRRSVANHLNDIGKDHPALLTATAREWAVEAGPDRMRLLRHALRSRVAAGDPEALAVLGFAPGAPAAARIASQDPAAPRIGDLLRLEIALTNPTGAEAAYAVRLRVGFARPGGREGVKVFALGEPVVAGGETVTVPARISLRQHTTRTHHRGAHRLEVLVNGTVRGTGGFDLAA
ncbi:MAG: DNA alkylation repair protein [Thermoleophilia bacterium]